MDKFLFLIPLVIGVVFVVLYIRAGEKKRSAKIYVRSQEHIPFT